MNDLPQQQPRMLIGKEVVDASVSDFIGELEARSAPSNTIRGYKRELRGFLLWLTETKCQILGLKFDASSITETDICAYLAMLYDRGLDTATRAKALSVIRSWFNSLGRRGYVKHNVAMLVSQPRRRDHLLLIPSAKKMEILYDSLAKINSRWPARDAAIIAMFYACSPLPSELVALNIKDINLAAGEAAVHG